MTIEVKITGETWGEVAAQIAGIAAAPAPAPAPAPVAEAEPVAEEKPKRGRPAKAKAPEVEPEPEIRANPEDRKAADEATIEALEAEIVDDVPTEREYTRADVEDAMRAYVAKFGMETLRANVQTLLGAARLSAIPDDPEAFKTATVNLLNEMNK